MRLLDRTSCIATLQEYYFSYSCLCCGIAAFEERGFQAEPNFPGLGASCNQVERRIDARILLNMELPAQRPIGSCKELLFIT